MNGKINRRNTTRQNDLESVEEKEEENECNCLKKVNVMFNVFMI